MKFSALPLENKIKTEYSNLQNFTACLVKSDLLQHHITNCDILTVLWAYQAAKRHKT